MSKSIEIVLTGENGTPYNTAKTQSLNPKAIINVIDNVTERVIRYLWNKTYVYEYTSSDSLATIYGKLESGYYAHVSIIAINGQTTKSAQSAIVMSRNVKNFYDAGNSTTLMVYNVVGVDLIKYTLNNTYSAIKTAFVETVGAGDIKADGSVPFTGTESFELGILVDTITEYTADAGVTIEGTLLKDNTIIAAAGTVSLPAYTFSGDLDSGMYHIGANNLGIGVNTAKVLDISVTGLIVVGTTQSGSGTVSLPGISFSADTDCGLYRIGANDIGFAINGVKTQEWTTTGSVVTGTFQSTGVASLAGIVMADATNIVLNGTTGTQLGSASSQKLGIWGATPIVKPTTGVATSTFAANTSGILDDSATFAGYKLSQIAKALQLIGLLT